VFVTAGLRLDICCVRSASRAASSVGRRGASSLRSYEETGIPEDCAHRLQGDPDDIIINCWAVKVEPPFGHGTQLHVRIFCLEPFFMIWPSGEPHEFSYLLEQVVVGIEEERQLRAEGIDSRRNRGPPGRTR